MPSPPPLVVTIALDSFSHDYFTGLRNRYFPGHCNYLEAHLTLFHHLPSDILLIEESLSCIAKRNIVPLEVTGIQNLGNGVAYMIASDELQQLHSRLQDLFSAHLISQDRKKLIPHITVQNKVTAYKARQTREILLRSFKPFTIKGVGLATWLYLGGPWQENRFYPFTGDVS